ncbi:hypothetical protein [Sinorhizobium phage phiM5]|nr:hypothetical protein [Sinorhizobium phage phiM5]
MVIAVMNNLPELMGFVATSGLAFWAGRRFERWKGTE